jgi:DNA-binding protein HU-beta
MIRQAAAVVVALCVSAAPLHAQNAPATGKVTVSDVSANVHKTPSTGSPVIGKAPRGAELIVTREVGDWVKVSWPSSADGAGYVRLTSVTRGTVAAPAAAKAPATAKSTAPAAAKPATSAKTAPATATGKTASTTKAAPAAAKTAAASEPAPVSSKAAVVPSATTTPVSVRTEQTPLSRPAPPAQARTVYVAPTHIFGVGAVAGGSTMGFGGSARAWRKQRLGLQLEVSRYSFDSVDLLSRATSTDIAPALLFALNDRVTDYMWLRPYVGVAAHLVRSSRTDLIFPDVTESASTVGARVFFGGEMSFSSLPQFALSADVGYYRMPEPFVGFEPGGMGFSISGHWYVK